MHIYKTLIVLFLCFVATTNLYSQQSISGITWIDRDQDGIRTSSDTIVSDVRVDLFTELGIMIQFTNSDSQGNYSFNGLVSGTYYLKFTSLVGLRPTLRNIGDDEFDSDAFQTGFTAFFVTSNSEPSRKIDGGFRSSIIIQTSNLVTGCGGMDVTITPSVMGFGGNLTYHWSNDNSTGPTNTITLNGSQDIIFTVQDKWNLPVSKKIFAKVAQGLGVTECEGIDLFDSPNTPINIMVSNADPGPNTQIDLSDQILGGQRTVAFKLLEGSDISSINTSGEDLFISNCSGCRTTSTWHYTDPSGDFLDLSNFEYLSFNDLLLDQGNMEITINLIGENVTATLDSRLESEGSLETFDKLFYFASFSNAAQIDLNQIEAVEMIMTTINESIDFKLGGFTSCFDEPCVMTLEESNDICRSESVTLNPETDCADGLIYFWSGLGFGKEQTVSPTDTTTYNLTVYDQNGCTSMYSTVVNVSPPPTLSLTGPSSVCNGDEATFEAVVSGFGPFTYEWNIDNADTSAISLTVESDTFVQVTVTDTNGCQSLAQQLVTVLGKASIALSTTDSKCSEPTGTVSANITGGLAPYTVSWSNGAVNTTFLTNVDAGTYEIQVIDANGCITIAEAIVDYLPCAQIGDYVWHDRNFDGVQDSTDIPIEGVVVLLLDEQNQEISRDTTDAQGKYLFSDLVAGNYYVEFITPTDYYRTIPNGTADTNLDSNLGANSARTELIQLAFQEKNLTIDVGFYRLVCIGDQVWSDYNYNDMFDMPDVPIEGIKVKLYDCAQGVIDSMLTDSDGKYQFCDLLPGSYSLTFCDHEGYVPVTPYIGDEDTDSDINQSTSSTICKNIMSGDTIQTCDAGFIEIASLGDYVWHDLNADGIQDSNEPPLANITLNLYSCDSTIVDWTTTDSNGIYLFDSLRPGTYYVEVAPLPNSIVTGNDAGDDEIDCDFFTPSNTTECIDLLRGTHISLIDAGLYFNASIGNYVWNDYNLDGVQNPTEVPIEGLKVYLNSCDSLVLDSIMTDADGYYLFDSLTPASYYISIDELDENQVLTTTANTNDTTNSDIDPTTLTSTCRTLISEEYNDNLDIGVYFLGKLGDFVWYDLDGNGIQETTETGVEDATVYLMNCNNDVISTLETDSVGHYCFTDIPYGDYKVKFDVPYPYYLVKNYEGNDDALDSDPDEETNITDCITLDTTHLRTIDAGITVCSTIGGTAWFETNYNNIQDPYENGVNGVKAKVYQSLDNEWVLLGYTYTQHKPGTPSDDGYWEMCVPPGEYYVEFSDISVLDVVEPNVGNDEELDSDATHTFGTNTTDIIVVEPSLDILNIGIGYKWQASSKLVSRYMSKNEFPIVHQIENGLPVFTVAGAGEEKTESKENHSVSVHPNPANDIIYLTNNIEGKLTYSIYDNSGNEVRKSITVDAGKDSRIEISIYNLISGTYYILVESKDTNQFIPIIKI